jgi:beta-xylosidase
LFSSPDLIHWNFEKFLIDASELPPDVWYKDRFWAPELRKIDGRFYLTFNCQNNNQGYGDVENQKHFHSCGIAVSDSIMGTYQVMNHDNPLVPFPSNDLSLFQDKNGKVYAFFNNGWTSIHHIYTAELDLQTFRLKEEPILLISQERGKWDGGGIEGAHVIEHKGIYYLFYSSWTKGYAVGYATADNVYGPWTKYEKNPLFGSFRENDTLYVTRAGITASEPGCTFESIGHNQIFTGPDGRYWTSYHGYIRGNPVPITVIDPIWFENGELKTQTPTYTGQSIKITKSIIKKNKK